MGTNKVTIFAIFVMLLLLSHAGAQEAPNATSTTVTGVPNAAETITLYAPDEVYAGTVITVTGISNAAPGTMVSVAIGGQSIVAKLDEGGKFSVSLTAPAGSTRISIVAKLPSGVYAERTVSILSQTSAGGTPAAATAVSGGGGGGASGPVPTVVVSTATTSTSTISTASCKISTDCVQAQCCHSTSCVNAAYQPDCTGTACTEECVAGTTNCGYGRCECISGMCSMTWTKQIEYNTTAKPVTTQIQVAMTPVVATSVTMTSVQVYVDPCETKCKMQYMECTKLGKEGCEGNLKNCTSSCAKTITISTAEPMEVSLVSVKAIAIDKAVAKDEANVSLEASGGNLNFQKIGITETNQSGAMLNQIAVNIPVKLSEGKKLASFEDKEAGVTFEKNEVTISMMVKGEEVATIKAKTEDAVGTGTQATAMVKKMQLETKYFEADFSSAAPEVGKVEVKLTADLNDIPSGAKITVKPVKELGNETREGFEQKAKESGFKIVNVAYAVEVEKEKLEKNVVGATNVTLKVNKSWSDLYGAEKVKIFKDDENGTREMLPTTFEGIDEDGKAVFIGATTGFSVFSLAAVEKVEGTPTPTATAKKQPGFELWSGIAALLVVVFSLRKRARN
jgi:hypothetical protein